MPIAATNQVSLRIVEEATFGSTPATPALKGLRYTSESLAFTKDTVVSEVIRNDRQRDFLAEVAAATEGDVNTELAFGDELDLALRGTLWAYFKVADSGNGASHAADTLDSAAPVDATVEGGTITGTGDFVADGFVPGATITLAGSATQDGTFKIRTEPGDVTATVITLDPTTPIITESGSGNETLAAALNTIDVVAAARTFTRSAGSFVVDGFEAGDFVRTEGFTTGGGANNGVFRIESVSATVLTMEAGYGDVGSLVDESGGGDERTYSRSIENGIHPRSYTVEKEFADVAQFEVLQGLRFGQAVLTIETGSIATVAYTLQGRGREDDATVVMAASRSTLPTNGASEVDPDTTDQLNATSNVGQLFEGGSALTTCITSIALTLNNNLRNVACVKEKFPVEVNPGFIDVTGTLEALFEDAALFNKFFAHTQSSLIATMTDAAGNLVAVQLPRIYYGSGSPTVPGGNEEVSLSMEFTAIREQVTGGKTVHFDVIPATLP